MVEDIKVDYGKSFKLNDDGTVGFANGDLRVIDGAENVAQRIIIAVTTELGEDQFNPDYGIDRNVVFGSDLEYDEQVDVFKLQLKKTLLEDDQIQDIPEIVHEVINYEAGIYEFIVAIELVGGENFTVNVGGVQV